MGDYDQASFILAVLSFIATLAGLFSERYRTAVFIGGLMGLAFSAVLLKIQEYIERLMKQNVLSMIYEKNLNIIRNISSLRLK